MKTKDIDPEKVRMLGSFGCTYADIGKYFGCDESSIRKKFSSEYQAGKSEMKLKLRTTMWKSAQNGSIPMQIWLSKNYLNMHERTAIDMSGNLETVLRECGFQENPVDKTHTEQAEALESVGLPPDTPTTAMS
jgi:hypothetical protein